MNELKSSYINKNEPCTIVCTKNKWINKELKVSGLL